VVCDIGGGSTEIITGEAGPSAAQAASAVSLVLGSVRLSERHLHHDPPTSSQVMALRTEVRGGLARAPRPTQNARLVGVGGTVTALAAIHHQLGVYDPRIVHGARIPAATVDALAARLTSLPLTQRRELDGLPPARADIIVAGAWLTRELISWSGASELVVSGRGLRWGLAAKLLDTAR
jgi:exopolyphosphatase/guanosine-5'-triphosphate,3'-diphosphate pyrophosphatase